MLLARLGFTTTRPPAALVTETAGVSTPSAMVNPVANRHFEKRGYSRRSWDGIRQPRAYPSEQWPTESVGKVTGTRKRFGLVCTITSQDAVSVDVLAGGRVQPLEQGKTSSFSFSGTEAQANEDLKKIHTGVFEPKADALTYFKNGNSVKDHTIALMPPITSSLGGAGLSAGQMPFRTYRGEVPMSE